ncbi:MAG: TonB-dependent receptor [Cytophagaceae bacterium]|nr:TonB-dependent receptor [Gemmatimonadaceae bacterium]
MPRRPGPLLCFFAFGVLSAAPCGGQAQGRITGLVVDSASGLPIVAARVQILELHRLLQTHEDGRFAFDDLSAGGYTMVVQRLGYRAQERRVAVATSAVDHRFALSPAAVELAPRIVTGVLSDRTGEEVLSPTSVLSGAALDRRLAETLAATLANQPGVSVSSLSPSTARPVIRGLSGDRIVILEDGQRPGDLSAMSGDHATSIDPLVVERIEVVRGPMSLLFGTSALGGVVNVIRDEVPASSVNGVHATLTAQGASVNRGGSVGGVVNAGRGAFAVRFEGTARRAGDTRTPIGSLVNTDVAEYNLGIGASRVGERGHVGAAYRFYANDYGIPGGFIGGHARGVDIVMRRHTARADADVHFDSAAFRSVRATVTLTDYGHTEFEPSGSVGTRFDLRSGAGEVVARHEAIGPLSLGAVGARLTANDFVTGGSLSTPSTRSYGAALFVIEELTRGAFTLQGGARYEMARFEPRTLSFIDVGGQRVPTRERTFASVAGSLGALWKASARVRAGVSVNRAFRVPDVTELYSNGPHLAANSFDVGDPSLEAETGLGIDAFVRATGASTSAEFAVFRSALSNFVFPSSRGRAEIGPQGGRPRFQFTNEDAVFQGAEGRVEWSATSALVFDATASYVRAHFRSTRDSVPVITATDTTFIPASRFPPFIPPFNGSAGVRYDRTRWFVSSALRFAARQGRTGDFEAPTASWLVPSMTAGLRIVRGATLHGVTLRLDNAFDREYRDHLSRIKAIRPEAGRNVSLLYRLTI